MDRHLGLLVLQIFLVIGLDSNHVFGLFVNGSADDGEGTLPDLQANLEFSKLERLLIRIGRSSTVDQASEVS